MIDPSVPKSYEEVLGPETRTALRLAKLVQVASATDDPFNNPVDSPLDSTGILWLEHINLQVGNRAHADAFYGEFLGCTRDPSPSWHYNLGDIPLLMQTVADCATQINRLISHRFALNDVQAAWELQATGECGKVILQPWG